MRRLLIALVDALLGPRCPVCNYRGRGWRTLAEHIESSPTRCGDVIAMWMDDQEEEEAPG